MLFCDRSFSFQFRSTENRKNRCPEKISPELFVFQSIIYRGGNVFHIHFLISVCRKPCNFSSVYSNAVIRTVGVKIKPSDLFSMRLMFKRSKSESLHDVSITIIGDTLSYGFLQTDLTEPVPCKLKKNVIFTDLV